ncbi:MAG: FimB/Mfa2 family fimbrial subunit [Bacteroidaceae bacterium]|nr:FimB/Mfa2 family fimbrial subunit [Bacteroidaceae bacterium]
MKKLRFLLMAILSCAIFSCQQMPMDDVELSTEDVKSLKVDVRSAGEAEIVYPIYLYAFNEKGDMAASQVLKTREEEMSLSLSKGDYQVVAFSGTSKDYQLPENPTLDAVITLVGPSGADTPLMMGRANVEITNASQSSVRLTLAYVVAALNVKLKDVPANVVAVQMSISPLHSTLSMGGRYGGSSQKIKVECCKVSDGVWSAETSYIFPGNGTETDFSIYFKTDDGTEVTYGHSFKGIPQANHLFNVTGTYAGGIIVGGNFDVTDWEGAIDVEFEFGASVVPDDDKEDDDNEGNEDIDLTGVPEVGTIWNGTIVADIGEADESGLNLLLMSLDEWDSTTSQVSDVMDGYSVNGISDWRLPTYEEVQVLKARFSGDNRLELNELIDEYDNTLWGLDGDERYLCTKNGVYYTFKFAGGTSVTKAGEKTSYYVRLFKTYRHALAQD